MKGDFLYPYEEEQKIRELALALSKDYKHSWFLGAGISKIAGYPLWDELVIDIIYYFQDNEREIKSIEGKNDFHELIIKRKDELIADKKFEGDPVETLTILKNCNEDLFNKRIREIFSECEKNQDNRIFEIIGRFINRDRNSVIITTNIDKGLQNYLNLPDERVTILGANPVKRSSEPKIIYLHGRIDYPDTWVFTEYEYAKAYGEPEHVM